MITYTNTENNYTSKIILLNESDVLDGEDKNANKISIMSFKELGLSEVTKADLIIYNDNYCAQRS